MNFVKITSGNVSAISPGALPKISTTSEANSLEICKKHFCNYFFREIIKTAGATKYIATLRSMIPIP